MQSYTLRLKFLYIYMYIFCCAVFVLLGVFFALGAMQRLHVPSSVKKKLDDELRIRDSRDIIA